MRTYVVRTKVRDGENEYNNYVIVMHNRCKLCTEEVIHEMLEALYGKPENGEFYWDGVVCITPMDWHEITPEQKEFLNKIGIN